MKRRDFLFGIPAVAAAAAVGVAAAKPKRVWQMAEHYPWKQVGRTVIIVQKGDYVHRHGDEFAQRSFTFPDRYPRYASFERLKADVEDCFFNVCP